jgi:hypothetical protein
MVEGARAPSTMLTLFASPVSRGRMIFFKPGRDEVRAAFI